jgi:acyl-CoA reductase-like NAD-dependent aldehyde dehydrogenase
LPDAPVLPLWIAGRAYLTLPPDFHDVVSAIDGRVLRRTPLCGENAAREALFAAQAALPAWLALAAEARAALIATLADALAGYAEHFTALICEEDAATPAQAREEVEAAIFLLRTAKPDACAGVASVVGAAHHPLRGPLALAVPALLAGATVVVRPAPQTPSAQLACAELATRCDFPPGVINVVYGGEELIAVLRAQSAQCLVGAR